MNLLLEQVTERRSGANLPGSGDELPGNAETGSSPEGNAYRCGPSPALGRAKPAQYGQDGGGAGGGADPGGGGGGP